MQSTPHRPTQPQETAAATLARRPRIALVYFNYGGGHRAAAQALAQVIAEQRRPWQVELVDLVEVLDPQRQFQRVTGLAPEDLYNKRLARGWTLGMAQELKLLQGLIRVGHEAIVRRLEPLWAGLEPDLVVSLVPNFNRALAEALATTLPGVPYLTVMTDLADLPPHFWIEPAETAPLPLHIVCGTARAVEQARAAGHRDEQIHLTTGMVLRPAFHAPVELDRSAERRALGFDAVQPLGVVMFGGQGSKQMLRIARLLDDRPLILLCGHNEALARQLRRLKRAAPHVVLGHTSEVVRYLRLGDYLIGKPGPGSLSEAVRCGLPVITFRNAWTMPQERYNTDWVREHGLGQVLPGLAALPRGVATLLADLPAHRRRVRAMDNRAVYEVVEIMAERLHAAALMRPGRQALDILAAARA